MLISQLILGEPRIHLHVDQEPNQTTTTTTLTQPKSYINQLHIVHIDRSSVAAHASPKKSTLSRASFRLPTPSSPPEHISHQISYTSKGLLVLNNYVYSKNIINGSTNRIYWRCAGTRKFSCKAAVRTQGKDVVVINGQHTHPPSKQKHYEPRVWCPADDDEN